MPPIDRAELAFLIGPFIPDGDAMLLEIGDIRVALEKPQKLVHDRFEMQLLGRHQGKALREIEAHLPAEDGERSGPGAVALGNAVFEHVRRRSR